MAIGFNTTSSFGNRNIAPDRSLARTSRPRVLKVQFGDGYEQRVAEGINNINESYAVTLNNRPKAGIDDVVAFLDSRNGVTAFDFTIPDTNGGGGETTIKVVCEDYGLTYNNDEGYSCSATFRRVYEA